MVFWISILVGGIFAWVWVRMGFFEAWTMLFNIVVAIYVSVFLSPVIVEIVPAAAETIWCYGLILVSVGAGVFAILAGISYTFLTGRFKVTFPRIFDNVGAGVLGFLAGLLVWSFAATAVSLTPIAENAWAQQLGFGKKVLQTHGAYLSWWCDLVHSIAASSASDTTAEQTIAGIWKAAEQKIKSKKVEKVEKVDTVEANQPSKKRRGFEDL